MLKLEFAFEPLVQMDSLALVASCISSIHSILPCHIHASYCCIAFIGFPLCCRCLSPLSRRCSNVVIADTNEDSMLSSEVPGKQAPLFILIQTHSLAPALFYCIRTTTFQLLHAAVVEPLSSAWPVIATVNRWNPLAWVGVVWALMCLLIHACLSCLLLLRVVSGLIHRGWVGMVMNMSYCVWAKCVNTIW